MSSILLTLMKALSFILGHVPRPVAGLLGRGLGRLAWRLDSKRRRIALENLDTAFGETKTPEEKARIARESYENLGRLLFEFLRIPWLKPKDLEGWITPQSMERFDRALEKGKGVILVTAHFGSWELLGAYLGLAGYPMDVVARELDSPAAEEFVRWARTRCGNRLVYKDRSMRQLIKGLSDGRVAGLLIDQNVSVREGVFVYFFGELACTNKGPAMLASVSRAPVVPVFIVRENGRHRVVSGEVVEMASTGDREADALENTARMTKAVEDMVRSHPEQWFWVHRRWKTRPDHPEVEHLKKPPAVIDREP